MVLKLAGGGGNLGERVGVLLGCGEDGAGVQAAVD